MSQETDRKALSERLETERKFVHGVNIGVLLAAAKIADRHVDGPSLIAHDLRRLHEALAAATALREEGEDRRFKVERADRLTPTPDGVVQVQPDPNHDGLWIVRVVIGDLMDSAGGLGSPEAAFAYAKRVASALNDLAGHPHTEDESE